MLGMKILMAECQNGVAKSARTRNISTVSPSYKGQPFHLALAFFYVMVMEH
jgi:hypothetical protein